MADIAPTPTPPPHAVIAPPGGLLWIAAPALVFAAALAALSIGAYPVPVGELARSEHVQAP